MNASNKANLALVVIDCERNRYSRYLGTTLHRAVEGRELTGGEVEHFRINPTDFIQTHCGPAAA